MKPGRTFEIGAQEPALILHWPGADGGLWDPEISTLVERLEEQLGVFVTCVGSGRGALSMNDAAAAARFMGCTSLVVVSLEGALPTRGELDEASTGFREPAVAVGSNPSVPAVAEAYNLASCRIERAA